MDANTLYLRPASLSDAPALRAIYAPYVEKTAITFECTVPDVEEFAARMRATLRRYPYLVAVRGGEIVGYTQMLEEARQIAVKRMVDEAKALGADAIIGVRYGSSQVMAGAAEVIAYGTAVRILNQ